MSLGLARLGSRLPAILGFFAITKREVSVATKIPTTGEFFRVDLSKASPEFVDGLIKAEKVIKITGADDLAVRTGSKNPNQFIIAQADPDNANKALFSVQIILGNGLVTNLDEILNGTYKADGAIDSASFYTVSTWDSPKARGKGGQFIIEAAKLIMSVMPNVQHLGTHSPLSGEEPKADGTHFKGFADWVKRMPEDTLPAVDALINKQSYPFTFSELQSRLKVATSAADIAGDVAVENALRQLAAMYVTSQKRDAKGRLVALDNVAGFHLRNGAMIWDINPFAHCNSAGADKSFAESFGFKVSYRYPRTEGKLLSNARAYSEGRLARSAAIDSLLSPQGHNTPRAMKHENPALRR